MGQSQGDKMAILRMCLRMNYSVYLKLVLNRRIRNILAWNTHTHTHAHAHTHGRLVWGYGGTAFSQHIYVRIFGYIWSHRVPPLCILKPVLSVCVGVL